MRFFEKNVDFFNGIFDNEVRNCDKYSSVEPDIRGTRELLNEVSFAFTKVWLL